MEILVIIMRGMGQVRVPHDARINLIPWPELKISEFCPRLQVTPCYLIPTRCVEPVALLYSTECDRGRDRVRSAALFSERTARFKI